jgi:hypothetical protein
VIEETEKDARAAMADALTKLLKRREPQTALILKLIAETPWSGDVETFKADVRVRILELNRQIAAFGDGLDTTKVH